MAGAEAITKDSGVEEPGRVLREAQAVLKFTGVIMPEAFLHEAEAITAHAVVHAAEVTNVGEDLHEGETLDPEIADEAEKFLQHERAIALAYGRSATARRAADKYLRYKSSQ